MGLASVCRQRIRDGSGLGLYHAIAHSHGLSLKIPGSLLSESNERCRKVSDSYGNLLTATFWIAKIAQAFEKKSLLSVLFVVDFSTRVMWEHTKSTTCKPKTKKRRQNNCTLNQHVAHDSMTDSVTDCANVDTFIPPLPYWAWMGHPHDGYLQRLI